MLVAVVGAIGYGIVYRDVVSRAREAYQQAEKHMVWFRDPGAKKKHFENEFNKRKAELDALHREKKISDNEYSLRLDALEFDRDFHLDESSLKYAYQWYKDAYELFSPPESKWVRMARAKAPETLELWKAELREQNVPYEDYMFE